MIPYVRTVSGSGLLEKLNYDQVLIVFCSYKFKVTEPVPRSIYRDERQFRGAGSAVFRVRPPVRTL